MQNAENNVVAAAEHMADAVLERSKHYVEAGVDAMQSASSEAYKIGRRADGFVHENAWLAVGVAAGAGVVLGVLLSRTFK